MMNSPRSSFAEGTPMRLDDVVLGAGSGISAVVIAFLGNVSVAAAIGLVLVGAVAVAVLVWLTRDA